MSISNYNTSNTSFILRDIVGFFLNHEHKLNKYIFFIESCNLMFILIIYDIIIKTNFFQNKHYLVNFSFNLNNFLALFHIIKYNEI